MGTAQQSPVLDNADEAYEVVERLRPGGTCELYVVDAVRGPYKGRRCVLKTLRSEHRDDAEFFKMLVSEGAILARLDHPNVVRLYGTSNLGGYPWLVIEYVPGISLATVLDRGRTLGEALPAPVAYSIWLQLLEALGYIHGARDEQGRALELRHRDVNPGNLIITWDGQAKLLDFGISQWLHDSEAAPEGLVKGTPGYLSPEQVLGGAFTSKGDIFSAGVVALMLLSGQPSPFLRDTVNQSLRATLHNQRPSVQQLLPALPTGLSRMLEASLATDLDKRPSASGLAMQLLSALEQSGTGLASRQEVQALLRRWHPERAAACQEVDLLSEPSGSVDLMLTEELMDLDLPAFPEPVFRAGAQLPQATSPQEGLPGPDRRSMLAVMGSVQRIVDYGVNALRAQDYAKAYEAFELAQGLDPSHRQVQVNLRRLRALGYRSGPT